ncbi:hypothetical protein [Microbacterium sp.]|uniref:hypothetical protein n=1 Tax=Microbacterium sp. TaxID=51671 RepID=UPI003242F9E6
MTLSLRPQVRPRRPLGPVHLYPEPPKKLAAGSPVASSNGRIHGKVKTVLPGDRYLIDWEVEGSTVQSVKPRRALLSRFTSTSPDPKKGNRS